MRKIVTICILLCLCFMVITILPHLHREQAVAAAGNLVKELQNRLRDGDIIFQVSLSGQSKAIQEATHSQYSHCGVIFHKQKKWYVLEASRVVTFTPLDKFIAKGKDSQFVIKRLKNFQLKNLTKSDMRHIQDQFLGKPYDSYFGWSDNRMYCSELVWKIYRDIYQQEIGKPEKLKDFDLSSPVVKAKLTERYGKIIPLEETVISPSDIFDCDKLYIVN